MERIKLGSDLIKTKENRMIIISSVDMEDWIASEFRKTEIIFQGRPYYLISKEKTKDNRYCYKLALWTEDIADFPGRKINYDLDYVKDRDETIRVNRYSSISKLIIIPLMPFMGLLWSGLKIKLHDKLGIHPVSITFYSIYLEFLIGLNIIIFVFLMQFMIVIEDVLPIFAVLFLLDAGMRLGRAFRGDFLQYGFFEWLFIRIKGKNNYT